MASQRSSPTGTRAAAFMMSPPLRCQTFPYCFNAASCRCCRISFTGRSNRVDKDIMIFLTSASGTGPGSQGGNNRLGCFLTPLQSILAKTQLTSLSWVTVKATPRPRPMFLSHHFSFWYITVCHLTVLWPCGLGWTKILNLLANLSCTQPHISRALTSPQYSPTLLSFSPTSPHYSPQSLSFSLMSPWYSPTSPSFSLVTPHCIPYSSYKFIPSSRPMFLTLSYKFRSDTDLCYWIWSLLWCIIDVIWARMTWFMKGLHMWEITLRMGKMQGKNHHNKDGEKVLPCHMHKIYNPPMYGKICHTSFLQWIFTSYDFGWPGSVQDSWVFKCSHLQPQKEEYFEEHEDILIDKCKSSKSCLFAVFVIIFWQVTCWPSFQYAFNNHDLTEDPIKASHCKIFNKKLSQLQIFVEHTFGWLKGHFPHICRMNRRHLNEMYWSIEAATIIHNMLGEFGDYPSMIWGFNGLEDDGVEVIQGEAPNP